MHANTGKIRKMYFLRKQSKIQLSVLQKYDIFRKHHQYQTTSCLSIAKLKNGGQTITVTKIEQPKVLFLNISTHT